MRKQTRVYNCVRPVRLEAGITQAELAKRSRVTRQTVVAIERGDYVPSLDIALLIARALRRSVDAVFSLERECPERFS